MLIQTVYLFSMDGKTGYLWDLIHHRCEKSVIFLVMGVLICLIPHTDALTWTTQRTLVRPVLNVHRKEMTIDLGSDLFLTCTGGASLTWDYPDVQTVASTTRSRIAILSNKTTSGDFVSILRVQNTQYQDTGAYTCRYVMDEDSDDVSHDITASVYVYVPDMDHLYAPPFPDKDPEHPIIGVMYRGTPFVLPCKPTHPRTTVTLRKTITGARIPLSETVTYDKKEGFRILYPTIFYNGMFTCSFQFNNTLSDLSVILSFKAGTAVPQPQLEASHRNVLVGETMTLRCFVRVAQGTIVHMEWTYPSDEHSDRIRQTEPIKESQVANGFHYDEVESTLTVRNVDKIDAGVYRCTVTNHDRKTNYIERTVYVRDETFVNLTPMSRQVEVKVGTTNVFLSMSVYAYPDPILNWYKGDTPIDLENRHYEVKERSDRTKLKIYNVEMEDAGEYVVQASTRDMNTSESIELIVTEPPTVELKSVTNPNYYLVGERYTMSCDFTGTPRPYVVWQWQPCHVRQCGIVESKWTAVINSSNIPQVKSSEGNTQLTVVAKESGYYRCKAVSKEGNAEGNVRFFVSDVNAETGFAQEANTLSPIEGDTLTLTCEAHALVFSSPRMYHMAENNQHMLLTNRSNLTIIESSTNYSWVQTLTLENIQLNEGGPYYCQTEDKYGHQHKSQSDITVRPMQLPVFTKQIDGSFRMEPHSKYVMECDATGLPLPTIEWYKDGEPIDIESKDIVFNANRTRMVIKDMVSSDAGVYECEASNRAGTVYSNTTIKIGSVDVIPAAVTQPILSNVHIGMIVGVFCCIIVLIIVVTIITRRHCQPRYYSDEYLLASKSGFNPDMPIDEQTDTIAYNPKWEFPRERLNFGMLLGQGAFGKVVRAEAVGICGTDGTTIVAVKMPKDFSDADQMKALLSELKVLIHIGQHLNIVNLLGACTKHMRKGILYVIVEYCRYGNLLNYLLRKRPSFIDTMKSYQNSAATSRESDAQAAAAVREYVNTSLSSTCNEEMEPPDLGPLTTKDLVCFAFQIARGMDYLSSRKYIHRDLAARNVLLADDGVVKIADFGLAKDCYKYDAYQKKTNGPVPVKWLALESLTHKIYTSKSDVWSYGILLWELFTVGGNPYPTVTIDETFVERLRNGYRMEKPPYATEQIYSMMLQCWAADPDDRPEFPALSERFGNLLQASVKQHYIDLETQQCLLVADRGATGYLRMAGSTLASYIPMSSDTSESRFSGVDFMSERLSDVISDVTTEHDSGYDYSGGSDLTRRPSSRTRTPAEYKVPRVATVDECMEVNECAATAAAEIYDAAAAAVRRRSESGSAIVECVSLEGKAAPTAAGFDETADGSDSGGSHTPDDLSLTSDPDVPERDHVTIDVTTAMVHSGPVSDDGAPEHIEMIDKNVGVKGDSEDDEEEEGGSGSDSSPFLNRSGSDKSDISSSGGSGPRGRGRRGQKGDSISSDASSGFHSCYYPEEMTPTDGGPGMFTPSIPPKEVMV